VLEKSLTSVPTGSTGIGCILIFHNITLASVCIVGGKQHKKLFIIKNPQRNTVSRRVTADAAEIGRRVYPHYLRTTAASYHAYQGVAPVSLRALMA